MALTPNRSKADVVNYSTQLVALLVVACGTDTTYNRFD